MFKKANAFYFIASSLATLTSLALIVTSNLPPPLILALAALSVLVLALSYKIISNNKKIEVERSKFAQKEQELENKIALGKEVEEAASKETERLNSQLNKLIEEKQNLDREAKKLVQKVNESEVERESLLKEKESLEQKLEAKINRVFEITGKLEKIMKEKDELGEQEEELLCKISRLCEQLQEKENDIAKKEERITELKRKVDNNKYEELQNKEVHKEIEKLCKEKHILYNKKEELYKRQEELYVELDELQCRFKEINQKNKNLSQELKEKSEELRDANDCINSQCCELDGIRKDCNNEVKNLKNLLLKQDSRIEQLEEDLLRNAEEKKGYLLEMLEPVVDEVEKLVNANEAIGDHSRKIILQETQKIKFILKEIMQFTPGGDSRCESPSEETFDFSLEDLGYVSRSSTPTKLPISPWAERCKRSQSQNVGLVKCNG